MIGLVMHEVVRLDRLMRSVTITFNKATDLPRKYAFDLSKEIERKNSDILKSARQQNLADMALIYERDVMVLKKEIAQLLSRATKSLAVMNDKIENQTLALVSPTSLINPLCVEKNL